jgi:hypothetical protein
MRFSPADQVQSLARAEVIAKEMPEFAGKPNMWSKAWRLTGSKFL